MMNRFHTAIAFLSLMLATGVTAHASDDIDALARDVDRLESVRQVKDLQRSYAHYAQYGLWDEVASLFTRNAGFICGSENIKGQVAIADWLTRRGGGRRGLSSGALNISAAARV